MAKKDDQNQPSSEVQELAKDLRDRMEASEGRAWYLTFTPSEVLTVAGVSADMLATWHKRKQLPRYDFPALPPGHGNRRRYSFSQAIVLALGRLLIDNGIPVDAAMAIASFKYANDSPRPVPSPDVYALIEEGADHEQISCYVFRLAAAFLFSDPATAGPQLSNYPFCLFAIYRLRDDEDYFRGGYVFKGQYVVRPLLAEKQVARSEMEGWMRSQHLVAALVVDVVQVVAKLLDGIRHLRLEAEK
ncbi:MAG TPA: hypothetical protein VE959_00200 [Bryobacteraceae bacterium]|nr:hypothetical protein [Bryobacteraceae bacterium]